MWLAERIVAMLRPDCRQGNAPTADALMRSRYTAFTLNNFEHIDRTHATEIKKDFNRSAAESVANDSKWLGLEVR